MQRRHKGNFKPDHVYLLHILILCFYSHLAYQNLGTKNKFQPSWIRSCSAHASCLCTTKNPFFTHTNQESHYNFFLCRISIQFSTTVLHTLLKTQTSGPFHKGSQLLWHNAIYHCVFVLSFSLLILSLNLRYM